MSNRIFAETGGWVGYKGSLSPSLKLGTHVRARRPSCKRSPHSLSPLRPVPNPTCVEKGIFLRKMLACRKLDARDPTRGQGHSAGPEDDPRPAHGSGGARPSSLSPAVGVTACVAFPSLSLVGQRAH